MHRCCLRNTCFRTHANITGPPQPPFSTTDPPPGPATAIVRSLAARVESRPLRRAFFPGWTRRNRAQLVAWSLVVCSPEFIVVKCLFVVIVCRLFLFWLSWCCCCIVIYAADVVLTKFSPRDGYFLNYGNARYVVVVITFAFSWNNRYTYLCEVWVIILLFGRLFCYFVKWATSCSYFFGRARCTCAIFFRAHTRQVMRYPSDQCNYSIKHRVFTPNKY